MKIWALIVGGLVIAGASVGGLLAYQAGYTAGFAAQQIVIVEEHPNYLKMKDCVRYYAYRNNWTGLFGKLWAGGGYGYEAAETTLTLVGEQPVAQQYDGGWKFEELEKDGYIGEVK